MPKDLVDELLFDTVQTPQGGDPCTATKLPGNSRVDMEELAQVLGNRTAALLTMVGAMRASARVSSLDGSHVLATGPLLSKRGIGSTGSAGVLGFDLSYTQASVGSDKWRFLYLVPESASSPPVVATDDNRPPWFLTWGCNDDDSDPNTARVYLASYYARASGGVRPFRRCGDETLYDLFLAPLTSLYALDATPGSNVVWASLDLRTLIPSTARYALVRLQLASTASDSVLAVRTQEGASSGVADHTVNGIVPAQGTSQDFWIAVDPSGYSGGASLQYYVFRGASPATPTICRITILGYRE